MNLVDVDTTERHHKFYPKASYPDPEKAACQGKEELFFPEPKKGNPTKQMIKAISICATCPVQQQCLSYALAHRHRTYGIWGGVVFQGSEQKFSTVVRQIKKISELIAANQPKPVPFHGHSGYTLGCRCVACRAGRRAYHNVYMKKKRKVAVNG